MVGRPKVFDKERSLCLAKDIFWKNGYECSSIADLMRGLNSSAASIYAAFGSKEQLFYDVISYYDQHEGSFIELSLKEQSLLVSIESMFKRAIEIFTQENGRGCLIQVCSMECSERNTKRVVWLKELRQLKHQKIKNRFIDAQLRGEIRADIQAEDWGEYYATLLQGIAIQARDGVSKAQLLMCAEQSILVLKQMIIRSSD